MSDRYVFFFSFDLRSDVDDRVVRVFETLARGEKPGASDFAAFPQELTDALRPVETLQANRSTIGTPVTIWSRQFFTMDDQPVLQRHIRLSLVMHDDW